MGARFRTCLWFDGAARDAAEFYAATFPDSHVDGGYGAPTDFPAGNAGDELVVEFTVLGQRFMGLDTLVLRKNTQDPTNMHERLAMKLFQRLGIKAPRESYARLFVKAYPQYRFIFNLKRMLDEPWHGDMPL